MDVTYTKYKGISTEFLSSLTVQFQRAILFKIATCRTNFADKHCSPTVSYDYNSCPASCHCTSGVE